MDSETGLGNFSGTSGVLPRGVGFKDQEGLGIEAPYADWAYEIRQSQKVATAPKVEGKSKRMEYANGEKSWCGQYCRKKRKTKSKDRQEGGLESEDGCSRTGQVPPGGRGCVVCHEWPKWAGGYEYTPP